VNAVLLDGVGDVDQVFVDHGHKGGVVPGGQAAENLLEGVNVVRSVVGRQGDAGQQNLDVRAFEGGQDGIQILARLVGGQATEAVVATEFDDHDFGVQFKDGAQVADGVLGGGSAGALVDDLVVVAVAVQLRLKIVRIGLAGLETVARGDAVAEADDDGAVGGKRRGDEKKRQERNDTSATNVHIVSVAKSKSQGTRD